MLSRLTGTVAVLVVLCLTLPVIGEAAVAAMSPLLALLVLVALVRLARPPSRRRASSTNVLVGPSSGTRRPMCSLRLACGLISIRRHRPAACHYSRADDGLSQPWHGRVWLNAPYGRGIGRWLDRRAAHGDGLALVFARTDTAWFHRAAHTATAICFVAGRLHFVAGDGRPASAAGAPSVLLAYGLPCARPC